MNDINEAFEELCNHEPIQSNKPCNIDIDRAIEKFLESSSFDLSEFNKLIEIDTSKQFVSEFLGSAIPEPIHGRNFRIQCKNVRPYSAYPNARYYYRIIKNIGEDLLFSIILDYSRSQICCRFPLVREINSTVECLLENQYLLEIDDINEDIVLGFLKNVLRDDNHYLIHTDDEATIESLFRYHGHFDISSKYGLVIGSPKPTNTILSMSVSLVEYKWTIHITSSF